ncbi:MAG: cell division topological specificity factor MinE [Acetobacteraceae bacterium]|nr:cell division topological specificity factor MinE [Acetobacteraceae bacterium]
MGAVTRGGRLASDRLRSMVVGDRTGMNSRLLKALRAEMLGVVSRYLEVDEAGAEVRLLASGRGCSLVACLPLFRCRRRVQTGPADGVGRV